MTNLFRSSPVPLLLLTSLFYLNFLSRIILAPLLPEIETALSLTHGKAGSLFLLTSCGYFVSLLGSGFVSCRLGHKRTITASLLAIGLTLLLVSFSSSLPGLQLSFLLLGMASGVYLPSAIASITHTYRPHQLGRAFGIHEIAPNLAFLTGPLLAAWLLPHLQWNGIFLLLSGATASAALLYSLLGRSGQFKTLPPDLGRYRELITLPEFRCMVVLFSAGISATIGVYSILPMFLVSAHNMDEQAANMLIGLSRSTTLFTAFLGGWLGDRFGSRKVMAVILLITGVLTTLLGIGPEALLPVWIWLQPLSAVCFFAPAFSVLSQIGPPESRNLVISLVIPVAFVLGGGFVPAVIALMADQGHFGLGLALTGCCIGGSSLLIGRLRTRQRK